MKRLFLILALSSWLFAMIFPFTGCSTIGAAQAGVKSSRALAFLTVQDAWDTVEVFMFQYGAKVRSGLVTSEKQARVDARHETFRQAVIVLTEGLKINLATAPPEEIALAANDVINLIREL